MADLFDSLFFPDDVFAEGPAALDGWPTGAGEGYSSQQQPVKKTSLDTFATAPSDAIGSSGTLRDQKRARKHAGESVSSAGSGYKSASSYTTDEHDLEDHDERMSASNNTSEDEKLEHRKERNRRHARETRKRKKEYVESLKTELDALRSEKVLLEGRMRDNETMRKELHEAWAQTLEETLALRASAEPDPARWLHLVDDEVVLVHPITPYRSYRKADVIDNRVVLMGVSDIIADAASLQVALCALCSKGVHCASTADTSSTSHCFMVSSSLPTTKVRLRFNIPREEIHFGPDGLMCPFEMTTLNLSALGLRCELVKRGCLRATFKGHGKTVKGTAASVSRVSQRGLPKPSLIPNATASTLERHICPKLKQLDFYFDPIAFWRQIQCARGVNSTIESFRRSTSNEESSNGVSLSLTDSFEDGASLGLRGVKEVGVSVASTVGELPSTAVPVITPNTLQQALKPSHEARVITEATRPFRITHVNEAWTKLCGFNPEEACGRTLRMLQGEDTDVATVNELVKDCVEQKATSMEVTNYDKQGRKFRNFLQVYPLCDRSAGETSHLLGVLTPLDDCDGS